MVRLIIAGILALFVASGCAYNKMYGQYAAACAAKEQSKVATFTDSGGKPVTLYDHRAGCGIQAPDNGGKIVADVAKSLIRVVPVVVVAQEVGKALRNSGSTINATGSQVSVSRNGPASSSFIDSNDNIDNSSTPEELAP